MMVRRHQQLQWIVLVAVVHLIVEIFANSRDKPSRDGLEFTTSSSTSSEGFRPSSSDFVRVFSPDHYYQDASQFSERNSNDSSHPHSIRLPLNNSFKVDILSKEAPTIIKLFDGTENPNETATTVETPKSADSSASFPTKSPRLYYHDIPPRKRGQGLGYPSASLNEISVSEPYRPRPHHDDAGYKFYIPDKYTAGSKYSRETIAPVSEYGPIVHGHSQSHVVDQGHIRPNGHEEGHAYIASPHDHDHSHSHGGSHGHGHSHGGSNGHGHSHGGSHGHGHSHGGSHGHVHDLEDSHVGNDHGHGHGHGYVSGGHETSPQHEHGHRGVISGNGHDLGYSAGPAHAPFSYPPPHYGGTRGHSADFGGFIGGPALEKALGLLLPSALLLTGVSALFPKRVQVPTQPIRDTQRQKRSVEDHPVIGHPNYDDSSFDIVQSQLIRREHRSADGEDTLYDYDDVINNPYAFSPAKSASSSSSSPASMSENYNHRANHAAPLAVQQIPVFQRVPQSEGFPPLYQLSAPQTELNQIPLRHMQQQPISYQPLASQSHGVHYTSESANQRPNSAAKVLGQYDSFNFRSFANAGTLPAEEDYFLQPTTLPQPTVPTIPYSGPTPATNVLSTPFYNVKSPKPKRLNTGENIKNVAKGVEAQGLSKGNTKDVASGKGAAKVLKELLLATEQTPPKEYDLSPNGPVIGLLTAAVEHGGQSDPCQRRALCEIAMRGSSPTATKFETFLWSLATLVPDAFTTLYDIDDVFTAIRAKNCSQFKCANPDLNLQE